MSRDANTGEARALVDEWARAGVRIAALAPGSRSTPLALALDSDERIRLEVFLDERSAAFFALGAAKASGRPAVVLTTSGTAAANIHPAVIEAAHARAPLVACTADRPPELRDTGANQAIDQVKLFGGAVRWFADVGVPEDGRGVGAYWRSIGARAVTEATGPPAGPVHLNLAFREPLGPTGEPVVPAPGRAGGAPWIASGAHRVAPDDAAVAGVVAAVRATDRGVVTGGWGAAVDPALVERFAAAAGWPLLADPISGLRCGSHAVSTYDALLRAPAFAESHRPDLVLQLGAPLTGRVATTWLGSAAGRILVDPDGGWLDPTRTATSRVTSDPGPLLEAVVDALGGEPARSSDWWGSWMAAEVVARRATDELLDSWDEPFEGRVARDLVNGMADGDTVVVGSSMPVRDVEGFARPRPGLAWLANRGASGIDGFNATVLGAAASGAGPVVGLTGDLSFLHDAGGLLGAETRGIDAVLVVLDNDGGGVFSFLPQAAFESAEAAATFERLFGTPHGIDLIAVAAAYGVPARRVDRSSELMPAVRDAIAAGGVHVIVVPSDRAANVARHREVFDTVAAAITGSRTA